MVLREAREVVITFIDYSAAFDTESHLFLDEALRSGRHLNQNKTNDSVHLQGSQGLCTDLES